MYQRGSGCSVLLIDVYINDLIITGMKDREVEVTRS